MVNKQQAVQIAEQARNRANKKDFSTLGKVEKRFIEVTETLDSTQPARVRDVAAWIVTFKMSAAWYEFSIDSNNGQIVRQRWSR